MQKIVFSLLILLFCWTSTQAQDDRPFRFGLQLSPSWSWINTDDKLLEGAGANWGGKLQVMAEKKIGNETDAPSNYYITSGIGFSFNQGGFLQNNYNRASLWPKSDISVPELDTVGLGAQYHYRLTFVEIPIGLKMIGGTGTDNRIRFYAEPALTLGFMTSNSKGDIGKTTPTTEDEIIRDDVNGLSLSWGLGAGIEYELSEYTRLVTGLAFQRQMNDFSGNGFVETTSGDWKETSFKSTLNVLTWKIGVFF